MKEGEDQLSGQHPPEAGTDPGPGDPEKHKGQAHQQGDQVVEKGNGGAIRTKVEGNVT